MIKILSNKLVAVLFHVCFIWFLVSVSVVGAQSDTKSYTFPKSNATVSYPGDWVLAENTDGSITLSSGDAKLILFDSAALSQIPTLNNADNPIGIVTGIRDLQLGNDSGTLAKPPQQTKLENGQATAYIEYTAQNESRKGWLIAIQQSDGSFVFANTSAPSTQFDTFKPSVLQILNRFKIGVTKTSTCTIHTDKAQKVQIRVGPGENRTSVAFLPAQHEFVVIGQAKADDGHLWWKLNREEVAPKSQASEAWVIQTNVTATGGCIDIPIVSGPIVIPIQTKTPTAIPGSLSTPVPTTKPFTGSGPFGQLIGSVNPSLCVGNSSAEIVKQAWGGDVSKTASCVLNLLTWEAQAKEQQKARVLSGQCSVQPASTDLDSYSRANWALSDLSAGYYTLELALQKDGQAQLAAVASSIIRNKYSCAWIWDTRGWFWQPS